MTKLKGPQLVKKFPAFCGTRRFVTAFTKFPPHFFVLIQTNTVRGHTVFLYDVYFKTDAFVSPASNERLTANDELEKTWKETVLSLGALGCLTLKVKTLGSF